MCLIKPFYTWDELKVMYPLNFKIDTDQKSSRYGEEYLFSIKALKYNGDGLVSPYVRVSEFWQPGSRHSSNRLSRLLPVELSEEELQSGRVYHGYHSTLRVCLADCQWYVMILKFYARQECFVARTYRDEFICGGHWSSMSGVVQICATHLTLGNISQRYEDGRIGKKIWRDGKIFKLWRGQWLNLTPAK